MLNLAQSLPPREGLIATGQRREAARLRSLQGSTIQLPVEDKALGAASTQAPVDKSREQDVCCSNGLAVVALVYRQWYGCDVTSEFLFRNRGLFMLSFSWRHSFTCPLASRSRVGAQSGGMSHISDHRSCEARLGECCEHWAIYVDCPSGCLHMRVGWGKPLDMF